MIVGKCTCNESRYGSHPVSLPSKFKLMLLLKKFLSLFLSLSHLVTPLNGSICSKDLKSSDEHNLNEDQKSTEEGKRERGREGERKGGREREGGERDREREKEREIDRERE